jgi:SAM-dependent methyltransferase
LAHYRSGYNAAGLEPSFRITAADGKPAFAIITIRSGSKSGYFCLPGFALLCNRCDLYGRQGLIVAQDSSKPDFWETRYRDGFTPWDAGKVPVALRDWLPKIKPGARILIPGCGAAYEAYYLAEHGFEVLAIDFSPAAVELARRNLACFGDIVKLADFFEFDAGTGFDIIYERAFLCALPRKTWQRYAERCAQILRPGGSAAGFFFFGDSPKGPPFGTSQHELDALLGPAFALAEDGPVEDSIAVFAGNERWMVWSRKI